jgi:hypothetical protein
VRRALDKLAVEGTLVKGKNGSSAVWRTPAAHQRHLDEQQSREAQQKAVNERVTSLRSRIQALGLSGTNYADNFGRIVMEMEMAEALVTLAEHVDPSWYVPPQPQRTRVMSSAQVAECTCHHTCADDPEIRCSLSGEFHVHPDEPCPVHPDAPGDR